jgi:hypothetical protein
MTRRTTLAVTGIGVLVAVGAWSFVRVQAQTRPVPTDRATITLANAGSGCGKSLNTNDGSTIHTKQNHAVQWDVVNNCAANAAVAVGKWAPNSPFAGGNSDCSASRGGGCRITLAVRGNTPLGTYHYTVSINGTDVDPDVVVEQ